MRATHAAVLALLTSMPVAACGGDGTGPAETEPVRVTAVPAGWFVAPATSSFRVGLDSTQERSGRAALFIEASAPAAGSFTAVSQAVRPDTYRGRRVRLSAWLRTKAVQEDGAGLYMRVDGPYYVQGFDNTYQRRLLGTNGWMQQSVVLTVPDNAMGISFGILLTGAGDLLVDDLTLEIVDPSVNSTGLPITMVPVGDSTYLANYYGSRPAAPVNLGFEGQ